MSTPQLVTFHCRDCGGKHTTEEKYEGYCATLCSFVKDYSGQLATQPKITPVESKRVTFHCRDCGGKHTTEAQYEGYCATMCPFVKDYN